jgi:hypothetical protein
MAKPWRYSTGTSPRFTVPAGVYEDLLERLEDLNSMRLPTHEDELPIKVTLDAL